MQRIRPKKQFWIDDIQCVSDENCFCGVVYWSRGAQDQVQGTTIDVCVTVNRPDSRSRGILLGIPQESVHVAFLQRSLAFKTFSTKTLHLEGR